MTDKEKAEELGNVYARQYRHNYGGDNFVFSNEECKDAALHMAKWKDAQFREYLEKKRNFMTLFPTEYDMCQEIINELFGESDIKNSDNDE